MAHKRNCLDFLRVSTRMAELCLLAALSGCALLGSGNIAVPHARDYHVTAPHQWKRIDQPESDQAYTLPSGNIAGLNTSCSEEASKHPLEFLSRDLLLGARDVKYVDRKTMTVDGAEGLYSAVTVTMNHSPFHMRLFVFPKQGCVFDFSLISPRPIPASETEEFLSFVKSFKYGKN